MLEDPILLNDWHVVARALELRPGAVKAARLLGVDIVLWHDGRGAHAWRDTCRHRGAKLSLGRVQDGCLVCAYHGWCYDGSGACTRIPAHPREAPAVRARVEVFQVLVRYDLIWVSLGEPPHEVPSFPEWDDPAFRKVVSGPYLFRAYGTRVLENFLDVGHYPFMHAGFAGGPGTVEMRDYEVEWTETGPVARDISVPRVWKADTGSAGDAVEVLYTYRTLRPLAASFRKARGGECFSMLDAVTPVDDCESLVWTVMALNYSAEDSDLALVQYQDSVTGQDVPIVESQRPRLLPLDPGPEIFVPSDKLAAAYRQWLKRLGLRYGVS